MKIELNLIFAMLFLPWIALYSCEGNLEAPKLGDDVTNLMKGKKIFNYFVVGYMTHRAFEYEVNGIKYLVAFEEGENLVEYIMIGDSRYVSPEGVRIGMTLKELRNLVGKVELTENLYHDVCDVQLPSGWWASIDIVDCSNGQLPEEHEKREVLYFSKYKAQTRRTKQELQKEKQIDEEYE